MLLIFVGFMLRYLEQCFFKTLGLQFHLLLSKEQSVLVFNLISMRDAIQNSLYPEITGEPVRLELNFSFPPQQATQLVLMGDLMASVAIRKFGVVRMDI